MRTVVIDGQHLGKWGEATAEAFHQLGFSPRLLYSKTHTPTRWTRRLNRVWPVTRRWLQWEAVWLRQILQEISIHKPVLYLSIQGPLTSAAADTIKRLSPGARILYWIGDVLATAPHLVQRLEQLQPAARRGDLDLCLVSTHGNERRVRPLGIHQVCYFPFGYAPGVHSPPPPSSPCPPYRWPVTFVAQADPDRARFIRELNHLLPFRVTLFGHGWNRYGLAVHRRVPFTETLRIHAASCLSLNHMKSEVDGGMNMRFYEIPAAGGFQLCSFQPEVLESPLRQTPTCRSPEECARLVLHYLRHESERETLRRHLTETVKRECSYAQQFAQILPRLGLR